MSAEMSPADAQIRDWMKALAVLIAPSMSSDEIRARIDALVPHLAAEYPPHVFCPEALTHTAKLCKFFPNFAELCEHLSAWQRPLYPVYGEAAGRIAHEAPPPKQRGAQSDEERAWATDTVRRVSAQLAALGEAKRDAMQAQLPPRPAAPTLSRAQLVEAYRRAGVKGPQIAEAPPLRAAASSAHSEVRRGPTIDADAPDA